MLMMLPPPWGLHHARLVLHAEERAVHVARASSPDLLGDAARGSKGWEVQRIKPRVALPLRAVEVERIAAADLAVEQGPLVERRRSIAVLQPSAPIANGCQGPLNEVVPPPRPMRDPAPTAVRGLRVDCSHISTPNAMPASS